MGNFEEPETWMETYSGHRFTLGGPIELNTVDLQDVVMALSRTCRYNGHSRRWFSVLEHECVFADWVEAQPWSTPRDALTALHHDDTEYVIGDLVRPAKEIVPEFKVLEHRIQLVLSRRFGFQYPFPKWLKDADARILVDERAQVMNKSNNVWGVDNLVPLGVKFWNVMGRFHWYTRWQWLRRHRRLSHLFRNGNRWPNS